MAESDGGGPGSVYSSRSFTGSIKQQPSWLQAVLSDLDEKMKKLASTLTEEQRIDTFAERAENYYRKRPQLLNLLQDLYNGYLSLADRYVQALIKNPQNPCLLITNVKSEEIHTDYGDGDGDGDGDVDDDDENENDEVSDAESSLSFQGPLQPLPSANRVQLQSADNLIAELVMKTVDYEILVHETGVLDRQFNESTRKMELQKSLLEVLESERLILLNENARLSYRVTNLVEENKGLASESMFMKRKASELARCVLKMREDHRVCLLSDKIEDLQGQIYGLEKRNKEYYEQLVRREEEVKDKKREMALEVCFEMEKLKMENQRLREETIKMMVMNRKKKKKGKEGGGGFWDKVKKFELVCLCGPNSKSMSC